MGEFVLQKEGKSTMNIIVCVKQVLDPEASPDSFKIDSDTNNVVLPYGVPPVLSPFDEQAVEAALRIKDITGGKITIISLGFNLQRDVVKKPLSMGADELILLEDPAFVDGDSWSTAYALAAAIRKIGQYDLIFCGRQAADWDSGQVGSGIAEILGLPQVTLAKKIEVINGKARVEKVTADGYEVVEVTTPALITVSNELGEPRYATIKGIMAVKSKEPIIWKPADIGVDISKIGAAGRRTKMLKIFKPVRDGKCEMITGRNEEEAGVNLAKKLVEEKLL
jgi:electron transfer flavoprotein beta subunit